MPSSKNSKLKTRHGIISSKLTRDYVAWATPILETLTPQWQEAVEGKTAPLQVGFYFHRDSRRRFDYINVVQVLADLFQAVGWLEDDDASHFVPVFLGYDITPKAESGVSIQVL